MATEKHVAPSYEQLRPFRRDPVQPGKFPVYENLASVLVNAHRQPNTENPQPDPIVAHVHIWTADDRMSTSSSPVWCQRRAGAQDLPLHLCPGCRAGSPADRFRAVRALRARVPILKRRVEREDQADGASGEPARDSAGGLSLLRRPDEVVQARFLPILARRPRTSALRIGSHATGEAERIRCLKNQNLNWRNGEMKKAQSFSGLERAGKGI